MIRAFILEDEAPARLRLTDLLTRAAVPCTVAGQADSLAAATAWLRAHDAPDLIFADIQLGDGNSLAWLRDEPPPCPVVFTTAHDDYLLEAFAAHGIAYLLKPVKPAELDASLKKYRDLGRHFAGNLPAATHALAQPPRRQRLLAQRGQAFHPVAVADVAYFFSENKLTFLVTRAGEKCLINEPLATLAAELDETHFFRLNRNYLAHIASIKSFTPVGKGRIAVQLQPRTPEEVQVSQESGAEFRAWASR